MHKCVRCGRKAASIDEIDAGCPCGSKAFVYIREDLQPEAPPWVEPAALAQPAIAGGGAASKIPEEAPATAEPGGNGETAAQPMAENAKPASPALPPENQNDEGEGKLPSPSYARLSFSSEDVENVKVLSEGVFVLDVNALSRNPMVLKDGEGVYYVKLPFEQKKPGDNGKK